MKKMGTASNMFNFQSLIKSTGILSVIALVQMCSSLVKEIVLSFIFGAGREMDAFLIAATIFSVATLLLQSDVKNGFITVLAKYRSSVYPEGEGARYFNSFLNVFSLLLLIIVVIAVFCSPLLVRIMTPGFDGSQRDLANKLTQITIVASIFLGLSSILSGGLNVCGVFAIPAFTQTLSHLTIIVCSFALASKVGIYSIAVGLFLGYVLAFLIQVPKISKSICIPFSYLGLRHRGIRETWKLVFPLLGLHIISPVWIVVDRLLASMLKPGSISALHYSNMIKQLPISLIVSALSTVIFPKCATKAAESDFVALRAIISFGIRFVIILSIPITIIFIILRVPIIRLLFERGSFDAQATQATAFALFFFSFGLFGIMTSMLLIKFFIAIQETRKIFLIGVFFTFFIITLDLILIRFLAHGGLALSNSMALTFQSIVLLIWLKNKLGCIDGSRILKTLSKTGGASIAMGGACFGASKWLGGYLIVDSFLNRFLLVCLPVSAGFIAFLASAYLLRLEEIWKFKNLVLPDNT